MTDSSENIVQRVWGNPSCVLLIFAASSMEFAVNPEAHWLFYTGKLPSDPIGRFISTTGYLKRVMLAPTEAAYVSAVRTIRGIHLSLEKERARTIPKEAYMDVLFMNIEYAMRSFELVFHRPMTGTERTALLQEFRRMGALMDIPFMPETVEEYQAVRDTRVTCFKSTGATTELLKSYRAALGVFRYWLLKVVYGIIVDERVLNLLDIEQGYLPRAIRRLYPHLAGTRLEQWILQVIVPRKMKRALID
jgi:hypothetical protein